MEAIVLKILTFGWVGLGVVAGVLWKGEVDKRMKLDDKLEQLQKKHTEFITESHAKTLMKEIIDPIVADQKEVKQDLKHILTALIEIQKEMAVQSAINQLQKEVLHNHNKGN
jgi:hypothetical protein